MKMPLKQFLDLYIGGDWKDECVIVDAAEHEPVKTFDGSEVVDAVWIDYDFDCGKVVSKLFIEVSLDDVERDTIKQVIHDVKNRILSHYPHTCSIRKTVERECENCLKEWS